VTTATVKKLKLKTPLHCYKIYPTETSKRTLEDLKTVAVRLTKQQAIDLATTLLLAAQSWDIIDVTAFRKTKSRSTGEYQLTVTSQRKDEMFQGELKLP
jgi:hypothetical protein